MMYEREQISIMGFTVRSENMRYTQWRTWVGTKLVADWTKNGLVGEELYTHTDDPVMNISDFGAH